MYIYVYIYIYIYIYIYTHTLPKKKNLLSIKRLVFMIVNGFITKQRFSLKK